MSNQNKNGDNQKEKGVKGLLDYWNKRSPILRFLLLFALGIILFYILYASSFFMNHLNDPIVNFQARTAGFFLTLIGEDVHTLADMISGGGFSISVKNGCDGIEATALLICGILSTPVAFATKWPGLLAGLSALFVLNLLRIAGLFLAGKYWPSTFEFLHLHGGVVIFTLITIIIWFIWANWAIQRHKS